ncbi:MAG: PIN domain-containing protein [archaeon]
MKLVIDSNRIISALIKEGLSRKIIVSKNFDFLTLDYIIEEVRKYKEDICKKAKFSDSEMELLFDLFMENVEIMPDEKILSKMDEAKEIMKDIDIYDSPIIACALTVSNEGIWTEDRHLKKQSKIKIWKTEDLMDYV